MSEKLARLPVPRLSAYPWIVRFLFVLQRKKYKAILNPMYFWGRSGPLATAMALFFAAIDRGSSPLPKELRALLTVRVSQINDCHFCVDINSMFLLERSETNAKLVALPTWKQAEVFTPLERSALQYAEAMTDSRLKVTEEIFAELKEHFSEVEIVELTGLIAYQNLSSKFNNALDVKPQGFCKLPGNS